MNKKLPLILSCFSAIGFPSTDGAVQRSNGKTVLIDNEQQISDTDIPPVPTQTYMIPIPEFDLMKDVFKEIVDSADGEVTTFISIAMSIPGTIIWYDHWEDGYETDVTNKQQHSTQIWGDGDVTTGCAPGLHCTDENDELSEMHSIFLINGIPESRTNLKHRFLFDAKDKIHASYPVSVTRGAFPETPGSYLAGAVELHDSSYWGVEFTAPVGQSTTSETDAFALTTIFFQAALDGTTMHLPDQSKKQLGAGDSVHFVVPDSGFNVKFDKPVQAHLVTGDRTSTSELRWFSLLPLEHWSNEYVSAMGESFGKTKALLYNPNDSEIKVKWGSRRDSKWKVKDRPVPARSNQWTSRAYTGSGSRLWTDDASRKFMAFSITHTEYENGKDRGVGNWEGQINHWGFQYLPYSMATPMAIIGYGHGCRHLHCETEHYGSVIYVSPVSKGKADIYVDIDNDGTVDKVETDVQRWASVKIKNDKRNNDMSCAVVWATKTGTSPQGEPMAITVAYGLDPPLLNTTDSKALELGTAIAPTSEISARTTFVLMDDVDHDKVISRGDKVKYIITLTNLAQRDLPQQSVTIQQMLDKNVAYVPGTTVYHTPNSMQAIPDGAIKKGSLFPLRGSGMKNPLVIPRRGGEHYISFEATIASDKSFNIIVNKGVVKTDFSSNPFDHRYSFDQGVDTTTYERDTEICFDCDDGQSTSSHGHMIPNQVQQHQYAVPDHSYDPHLRTWRGHHIDFHGECDIVLLHSDKFADGRGLDIHIRTEIRKNWSFTFTSNAVVRIGSETMEMNKEGTYYLNGLGNMPLPGKIAGFTVTRSTDEKGRFSVNIDLGEGSHIFLREYKHFVLVSIVEARECDFEGSVGLMGEFLTGRMLRRDGETVESDPTAYAQEWQVRDTEGMLFRDERDPQFPKTCRLPAVPKNDRFDL